MANQPPPPKKLGLTEWLICFVASLGFAFDIYVLLVLPLIVGPALSELGQLQQGTQAYNDWVGYLFFIPAIAGGFFGLIGGYLTDLFGRRAILVFSILLYAFAAFAAGYSTSLEMLLLFRCLTFVGVCVEFVAAVAWLAEMFPNPKQRESVLGYTQAFSSIGGLMVTGAYYLSVTYANSLPEIFGAHAAWRYTLLSGVIPAIPLIIIRPFLPESPEWQKKKQAGTLKRPSIAALFAPEFRNTTIITTIIFACSYGAAFGAIQHIPRIVPGLSELADMAPKAKQQMVGMVQMFQEVGGLTGRLILAFLAIRIASRQKLLRLFQMPGLVLIPFVFYYAATTNLTLTKYGMFFAGLLTVAQLSFWGNYLPRMYPVHLRGTGESFAANVGGRMIGTSAALLTTTIASKIGGASPFAKTAYAAAIVGTLAYVIGFIASFRLPEPNDANMEQ